jgi:hypothetical protein
MPINMAASKPALESFSSAHTHTHTHTHKVVHTIKGETAKATRCAKRRWRTFREEVGGERRVRRHPRNNKDTDFANVNRQIQRMQQLPRQARRQHQARIDRATDNATQRIPCACVRERFFSLKIVQKNSSISGAALTMHARRTNSRNRRDPHDLISTALLDS